VLGKEPVLSEEITRLKKINRNASRPRFEPATAVAKGINPVTNSKNMAMMLPRKEPKALHRDFW
jgi:hypothetical protein